MSPRPYQVVLTLSVVAGSFLAIANSLPAATPPEDSLPVAPFQSVEAFRDYLFENKPLRKSRTQIEQLFPRNKDLGTIRMLGGSTHNRIEYRLPLSGENSTLVVTFASRNAGGVSVLAGFWIDQNGG